MIELKIFAFNNLGVNTFVVFDQTQECVIIDAACNSVKEEKILSSFIEEKKLKPTLQIHTHGHFDHLMGNKYVTEKYGVKTALHKADVFLYNAAVMQAQAFSLKMTAPTETISHIDENDTIAFGNAELNIFHIPGHSPGSLVFFSKTQKFAIVGDVLFRGSIGRTDLPGGNYDTLINGIKTKLLTLEPDFTIFPGHGSSTTIRHEAGSNPFLK